MPEKRSASQPLAHAFKQNVLPSTTRAPIFYKKSKPVAMTEAKSLPLGVPAFKPLKSMATMETNIQQIAKKNADAAFNRKAALYQFVAPNLSVANESFIHTQMAQQMQQMNGHNRRNPMVISPQANAFTVPAFQALPSSVSRISTGQIVNVNKIAAHKATINNYSSVQRIDVRLSN